MIQTTSDTANDADGCATPTPLQMQGFHADHYNRPDRPRSELKPRSLRDLLEFSGPEAFTPAQCAQLETFFVEDVKRTRDLLWYHDMFAVNEVELQKAKTEVIELRDDYNALRSQIDDAEKKLAGLQAEQVFIIDEENNASANLKVAAKIRTETYELDRSLAAKVKRLGAIMEEFKELINDPRFSSDEAKQARLCDVCDELRDMATDLMTKRFEMVGRLEQEKRNDQERKRELDKREASIKQVEVEQQRSKRFILKNADRNVDLAHLPRSWTDANAILADIDLRNAEAQGKVLGEQNVRATGDACDEYVWCGVFIAHQRLAKYKATEPCDTRILTRDGELDEDKPFVLGMMFTLWLIESGA